MVGPSKIGNIKNFQDSVRGGGAFIKDIPANGSMVVRFLTEPDEWVEFESWYDQASQTFGIIMDETSKDEMPSTANVSRKYLANVLDTNEGTVIPLRMPRTLADDLNEYLGKYGSLVDRDYELTRSGQKLNTKYRAIPEAMMERPMGKYQPLDLIKALEDNEAFASRKRNGSSAASEEAVKAPTPPTTRKLVKVRKETSEAVQAEPEPEPVVEAAIEPESFTAEAEAEDGESYYTPAQLKSKTAGELKFIARDNGIETAGLTKDEILVALLGADGPSSDDEEKEPF